MRIFVPAGFVMSDGKRWAGGGVSHWSSGCLRGSGISGRFLGGSHIV